MALLNYTTEISADKTIGEIYKMLSMAKAQSVLSDFDAAGNTVAIAFKIQTQHGVLAYRLPANFRAAQTVLNSQVNQRKVPRRYFNDLDQARRVTWRILRQWLEAQLALVELGMAKVEEIFLPYTQGPDGKTLFEKFQEQGFSGLTLPARGDDVQTSGGSK